MSGTDDFQKVLDRLQSLSSQVEGLEENARQQLADVKGFQQDLESLKMQVARKIVQNSKRFRLLNYDEEWLK